MAEGESVGMMEGAFFVSRKEVIDWLNSTFVTNFSKIEQTHTGAIACQIWDACFPGSVAMNKVNWSAKQHYEKVNNYKVLQKALDKTGVKKHVPVDSLLRGKYQDNLEFMQWIYNIYQKNNA